MSEMEVVRRYAGNPIINPQDIPGCDSVYNAGAVRFKDRYILLVSLIMKKNGVPSMHLAESTDGKNFRVNKEPFIVPEDDPGCSGLEYWSCDPRITPLEGTHYIIYPAYGLEYGVVGILGRTDDFRKFQRIGIISLPDNRSPVLFPEKVDGLYVRLDRPMGVTPGSLWLSYSPDLIYWGRHRPLLMPDSRYWCNCKVGPCSPPVRVDDGWLLIYHAVSGPKIGAGIYYLAAALLDPKDPSRVMARSTEPILAPVELYERIGKVNNVVFSCGAILEDNGRLKIYYGGADTCICLAECSASDLIKSLQ